MPCHTKELKRDHNFDNHTCSSGSHLGRMWCPLVHPSPSCRLGTSCDSIDSVSSICFEIVSFILLIRWWDYQHTATDSEDQTQGQLIGRKTVGTCRYVFLVDPKDMDLSSTIIPKLNPISILHVTSPCFTHGSTLSKVDTLSAGLLRWQCHASPTRIRLTFLRQPFAATGTPKVCVSAPT